jgi:threonine dehydrogenase-like Zn-dependent dehydrogenase
MKAAVLRGPQDIRAESVVDPEVETSGIIIRVKACGVCGSDLHVYKEEGHEGTIFGHEFSGDVVEVGPGVSDIRVGERVTAVGFRPCGQCFWCRQGKFHRCSDMALLGYQMPGAIDLIKSGKVNTRPFVTHRFSLDDAGEAFRVQLKDPDAIKVMILP